MDTTFITIHDLSVDANILYSSDSIVDVLGYSPEDVVNRSCWEFFHPDQLPLAHLKHEKTIELDRASVLAYCKMRDKMGRWVGCEVVFTVVYDVLVGCTSIYKRNQKSENRAAEAPIIRRLFTSSPKDPRYHMLSHLSSKFSSPLKHEPHERRAALFLNRYTRTLTIMFATDGLAEILGIRGEDMIGRSFYYCIRQDCLRDAVRCLENAKSNDSIAYLRFWYRDLKQEDLGPQASSGASSRQHENEDEEMPDIGSTSSSAKISPTSGLHPSHELPSSVQQQREKSFASEESDQVSFTDRFEAGNAPGPQLQPPQVDSCTSFGDSNPFNYETVFGDSEPGKESFMSSSSTTPRRSLRSRPGPIELEAVISCASDGLVVCMRRARPTLPQVPRVQSAANGLCVAPWAKSLFPSPSFYSSASARGHSRSLETHQTIGQSQHAESEYMNAIRDIGVFAWAIAGINGSLAEYGRGTPSGHSVPEDGLPIWQSDPNQRGPAA